MIDFLKKEWLDRQSNDELAQVLDLLRKLNAAIDALKALNSKCITICELITDLEEERLDCFQNLLDWNAIARNIESELRFVREVSDVTCS